MEIEREAREYIKKRVGVRKKSERGKDYEKRVDEEERED